MQCNAICKKFAENLVDSLWFDIDSRVDFICIHVLLTDCQLISLPSNPVSFIKALVIMAQEFFTFTGNISRTFQEKIAPSNILFILSVYEFLHFFKFGTNVLSRLAYIFSRKFSNFEIFMQIRADSYFRCISKLPRIEHLRYVICVILCKFVFVRMQLKKKMELK